MISRTFLASNAIIFASIITGAVSPALAFQTFTDQRFDLYSSPGVLNERFVLNITTEDSPTTLTFNSYTNPGVVTPGGGTPTTSTPLLSSSPYTFTGYLIKAITGKSYDSSGNVIGEVNFSTLNGSNAETVGVFNYQDPANPGSFPIDLIAHARPDNLWNPGKLGLGFSGTSSIPASGTDNFVSIGGIAFDVFAPGTTDFTDITKFDEPYQLFTVAQSPTGGAFTSLKPGDYAGCPGSCIGVKSVPAPLPILAAGPILGCVRRLRRLSSSIRPDSIS